jgi:ArsR family transcriptional regulator, arsenate/arsenite/antimonite-responsive transcriptional repressor
MTDDQFHKVAKALADPQRFAIYSKIARQSGEVPCKKLVEGFDVSQATISHHLKELSNAGLIDSRKDGQCAYLSARRAVIEDYQKELRKRVSGV